MNQIVECVPNFSEGNNTEVIQQITGEITASEGICLLDVDPGKDTNRTVVTFVGEPDDVIEAAFKAIKKASEVIDMSVHKGAHPRMGATDVCPLIPVSGITKEECITWAKKLAKRVGNELGIPVYLYGDAATRADRERLPDIREGEYEALPEKLKNPDFKPDEGPAVFNPSAGATAIGVRGFMLAYNVNLNTKEVSYAREIAGNIRESGVVLRDKNGDIIRNKDGKAMRVPGKLQYCQAGGWYIEEYGYAQVTMNLHNCKVTGLHTAYDAVCEEADRFGIWVTGSELVGVTPKQAIIDAGKHYLEKQGKSTDVPEEIIVQTAIQHLGLNDTAVFKPDEKIIEYAIQKKNKRLVTLSVERFIHELASDSPAPGGGSVSALSGALSAALSSMVAQLTLGKEGYERYNDEMKKLVSEAQNIQSRYIEIIDRDTDAFNAYIQALRMPKKTDEEKEIRRAAIQRASKEMTDVPFTTLNLAASLIKFAEAVVQKGNTNALSDAVVSATQAEAAAEGAWMNVMINLPCVKDSEYVAAVKKESDELLENISKDRMRIVSIAKEKLNS